MVVVVGLGNMGGAIAQRLAATAAPVTGVDLDAKVRAQWTAATGASAVAELTDVDFADVDRVVVVVRLTAQAEQVLDRLAGLVAPGTGVFVATTLEYDFARRLGRFADRGLRLVELPVSGGRARALDGELTVMAAGPLTDADERFLTATIASHLVRFDAYGDPTLAKLINNATAAYNARAFAEMLILGHQHGIDAARLNDVLLTSSGASWMAAAFADLVDDLLDKDVALLRDQLGGLPVISLAADAQLVSRLRQARALLGD